MLVVWKMHINLTHLVKQGMQERELPKEYIIFVFMWLWKMEVL